MVKKIFIAIVFCALCYPSLSAQGYRIEAQIDGAADSTFILTIYSGNGRFIRDSAKANEHGVAVFSKDKPLTNGMYTLIAGKMYVCDLLVPNNESQHFSIHYKKDEKEKTAEVIFKNSPENTAFAEFQKYMGTRQAATRRLYERAMKDTSFIAAAKDSMRIIEKEEQKYLKTTTAQWKGSLFGAVTSALIQPPPMPGADSEEVQRDSIFWVNNYQWEKNHYFDNIDLTDERLLNTPFFRSYFEAYFAQKIIQEPDSIIAAIHPIIDKAKTNQNMFMYVLGTLFNKYIQNKTVTITPDYAIGTEAVVIDLIKSYYFSGEAEWAQKDSVFMRQIHDYVKNNEPSLVGKKSQNLTMEQLTGQNISLYDLKATYTILIFFDTECGHCKKEIPLIHELYKKYQDKGVQVFCVYIKGNGPEWAKFVEEKNLDWINVWDPYRKTKFTNFYNVDSTPQIFLLNKEKTIIARHASVNFLEQVLGLYIDKKPITNSVSSGIED